MIVEALIGIILGSFTGIIPGVHPNTLSAMIIASTPFLSKHFSPISITIILISMAITHTIVNIIPTTFAGIPEDDTALAIYPSHEMVLEGRGFEAISISAFSSFLSILISLPLFLILMLLGNNNNYIFIEKLTKVAIIITLLILLITERDPLGGSLSGMKKRFYFMLVFLSSGFLGYTAQFYDKSQISILFPLLSGLFGAPVLIQGMISEVEVPQQEIELRIPSLKDSFKGAFAGMYVSLFPGMSSGIATALASSNSKDPESYIATISSANTSNAFLNFAVLISADHVRSGVADAVSSLVSPSKLYFIPPLSIAVSFIALPLTLLLAIFFTKMISKLTASKISIISLIILSSSVAIFNGINGLLIYTSAIPIGMSTFFFNIRRVSCMGAIMLPLLL